MCMGVLLVHMFVHHLCAWCPQKPEGDGFLGVGVTDGCKPLARCWKLNPGLLVEQGPLLTAEPPL